MRTATVDTGLPTDPSLRTASLPSSTQVIGDISVWPKTATLSASGNTSAIRVSSFFVAGAAPQDVVRSRERSRSATLSWSTNSCHALGTRKALVTRSSSSRRSTASGSKAPLGRITIVPPMRISGAIDPMAPMWNIGEATRLTSSDSISW